MISVEILAQAQSTLMVTVDDEDRREFARALILQGYTPVRAAELATTLENSDGALQMLARHRIRYSPCASSPPAKLDLTFAARELRDAGLLSGDTYQRCIIRIRAMESVREGLEHG